jgi:phosphotransferase system enzyme I (PtsI)
MTDPDGAVQRKLKGIPVSPGIIIGKAHLVDRSKVKILYQYLITEDQVNFEVDRFKMALKRTEDQFLHVKNRMPEQVKKHGFIIESHLMILKESMLTDGTLNKIREEKINAEWAVKKSLQDIRQVFEQIDDDYIRGRINDVENVTERILRNLSKNGEDSLTQINQRVIIVARDLSPVDTTEMNIGKVMGFITDVGGKTSHTAIMAQALEIPAVVALEYATERIMDGDLLIVDGNTGEVIVDPDEETIIAYQEKHLEHESYKSSIARMSHLPAVTQDDHKIDIMANIEFLEEVAAVRDYGAEGIGLYRTEFLYLRSKGLPSEEILFEDYKEVAEIISPSKVNIRTLDLGGDKFASDVDISREMNPALGLRAIRFCLREPEIFKNQLRAILRASAFGNIQVMFPMISGLQEIFEARRILEGVKADLDREGVAFDRHIKVGVMIEIPSAVTMAEVFARHVDFFSIGTNDLIQYALAIDRVNEHVAYMYEPFHPAILRMISHVVGVAKRAGIGVALCGEMAGDPLCIPMLLGMGLTELSMNSRAIPIAKRVIRSLSMKEARRGFKKAIELVTPKEIRGYVIERMKTLAPDLHEKGYFQGAESSGRMISSFNA